MTLPAKAAELLRLHLDPELLVLVNTWDVISATIVAGLPGCRAIATASHSIAASHGYPDGEQIPAGRNDHRDRPDRGGRRPAGHGRS